MEPSPHLPQHEGICSSNFSSNETRMPGLVIPTPAHTCHLKYEGYTGFVTAVHRNLYTGHEILEFSGVSAKDFDYLSSDRNRPLKSAKLSYNFLTEVLTVKMPGLAHKIITGFFRQMVDAQLFAMGLYRQFVSLASPLNVLGNWAKEPDSCWGPESIVDLTVILEVGTSESTPRLAIDARRWLETPGATVQTCITIDFNQENNLTIEVWGLGKRVYAVSSRNSPSPAVRVQHVEIIHGEAGPEIHGWKTDQNTDTIPTDEIRLDFALFIGRPAIGDLEHDIIIDRNLLKEFANGFWIRLDQHLQQRLRGR